MWNDSEQAEISVEEDFQSLRKFPNYATVDPVKQQAA